MNNRQAYNRIIVSLTPCYVSYTEEYLLQFENERTIVNDSLKTMIYLGLV